MKTLFATVLFVLAGSAQAVTVQQVRQAIESDPRASWSATQNKAPEWESTNNNFVGGARFERSIASYRLGDSTVITNEATPDLPESFDWRDHAGINFMSEIRHQGDCGSCVAFAAMTTLESTLNIACGQPMPSFALSRQHFFSCGGGQCSGGWRPSAAVDYLANNGVPDEACFPYQSGDGLDAECSLACNDAGDRSVQPVRYERPTRGFINVESIKRGLMVAPLLANMILFEDLQHYESGVYRHVAGNQQGSHAITLVGWDDADQAWIAANSWGTSWGEGGYFKIAYDDQATLPGRYTYLFDVTMAKEAGICQQPR